MPMDPNQYRQWCEHWSELKSNALETPNPNAKDEFDGMFFGIITGIILGIVLGVVTT